MPNLRCFLAFPSSSIFDLAKDNKIHAHTHTVKSLRCNNLKNIGRKIPTGQKLWSSPGCRGRASPPWPRHHLRQASGVIGVLSSYARMSWPDGDSRCDYHHGFPGHLHRARQTTSKNPRSTVAPWTESTITPACSGPAGTLTPHLRQGDQAADHTTRIIDQSLPCRGPPEFKCGLIPAEKGEHAKSSRTHEVRATPGTGRTAPSRPSRTIQADKNKKHHIEIVVTGSGDPGRTSPAASPTA